jgi:hypothetical protein
VAGAEPTEHRDQRLVPERVDLVEEEHEGSR